MLVLKHDGELPEAHSETKKQGMEGSIDRPDFNDDDDGGVQ